MCISCRGLSSPGRRHLGANPDAPKININKHCQLNPHANKDEFWDYPSGNIRRLFKAQTAENCMRKGSVVPLRDSRGYMNFAPVVILLVFAVSTNSVIFIEFWYSVQKFHLSLNREKCWYILIHLIITHHHKILLTVSAIGTSN